MILLAARCVVLCFSPLTDPTEGRYAVIAKEMVVSGDWVTPHLWMDGRCVPFLGKPPLYFWAAAACMKLFGINEFSARLPGVISFALTLLVIGVVLGKYMTQEIAWRAVFLCLSSVVLFVSSGIVIVDILLTMCITGALLGYYAFCRESNPAVQKRWSLLVFVMLGLGFMTKGPVAIVLFGLPVLLWTVWFRRWKEVLAQEWYWGITLFAVIVIPWFFLVEERNPGFLRYFFVNENFLRFTVHQYGDRYGSGHEHLRGAALWMMLLAAAPWSFYALYRGFQHRKQHLVKAILHDEELAFFLGVVVVNTLFWCLARQLLMTYLYAMVPVFAVGLSILMARYPQWTPPKDPLFKKTALIIGFALIIGIPLFPLWSHRSAKNIVEKASEISKNQPASLYFIRRVPYSAYFYGNETVIPHPDETVEAGLVENKQRLYAAEKKYYNELPKEISRTIDVLSQDGVYVLFRLTSKPLGQNHAQPSRPYSLFVHCVSVGPFVFGLRRDNHPHQRSGL